MQDIWYQKPSRIDENKLSIEETAPPLFFQADCLALLCLSFLFNEIKTVILFNAAR